MSHVHELSRQLKEFHFGNNFSGPFMQDLLQNVDYKIATTELYNLNSIAKLVFHINYYIEGICEVLKGGELSIRDKFSFDMHAVNSEEDWQALKNNSYSSAKQLADLIEQLPESKLSSEFVKSEYGTYFRNLTGLIAHSHYHLGQIAIIKKIIVAKQEI